MKAKKFFLIRAKTSDNIYLPPDFIENLYEQFDSKLVKQYIEGEFVNINSDLAYYCFDRKVNVVRDKDIPVGDDNRIILSFDFNVNPMCAVEIIISGKTRYQTYEHKISQSNTEQLCESVIASLERRYTNARGKNIIITGDSSGTANSTSSSHTDFAIIKEMFDREGFGNSYLYVPPANPPVRERINYVNAVLEKKLFFIAESCRDSIKDRELVSWKKGSEKFVIDKSDRNITHLSDAADYGLWRSRALDDKGEKFIVGHARAR